MIIDLSVERIRSMNVIKGEHIIHYLTGPSVFTSEIMKYIVENHPSKVNNHNNFEIENIHDFVKHSIKIEIGQSETNLKKIILDKDYPTSTEFFVHNFPDKFSCQLEKNVLTITRTDSLTGWGQNLIVYANSFII